MSEFWITDDNGDRLYASTDFENTWVTDIDEAVELLSGLDWENTSDNSDIDDSDSDTTPLDYSLYHYIFDAAEDLGLEDFDFDFESSSMIGTLTYTDHAGKKRQAQFEFGYNPYFPDKEDATRFLKRLDWEIVDDED